MTTLPTGLRKASNLIPDWMRGWWLRVVPGHEPTELETGFLHRDPNMAFQINPFTRFVILVVGWVARLCGLVSKPLARLVRRTGFTWSTQTVVRFKTEVTGFPIYRFISRRGKEGMWHGCLHGAPFTLTAFRLGNSGPEQPTEIAFKGVDGVYLPFELDQEVVVLDDPESEARVVDIPAI